MSIPYSWFVVGGLIVAAIVVSRGQWSNPILDQISGVLRSIFGSLLNWQSSKPEPQHCIESLLHVQEHLADDAEAVAAISGLVTKVMAKHAKAAS